MLDCIFCKIIEKSIPSKLIYEDDEILAFHDVSPKADVHFLVIPKLHLESMLELQQKHQSLIGKMMLKANELAVSLGLKNGYKVQINTGLNGGQEVFHLHIHVFGNK